MTFPIELDGLGVRFGDLDAVDDVTLSLPGGRIYGLLGRNGAGKSTLLSVLAGYRRATSGVALVDGGAPFEDARLMCETCLVREHGDFEGGSRIEELLSWAADLRPRWDRDLAEHLLDRFELPRKTKAGHLSTGQRSALAATVGLASRAPLTMFDEAHLGMDAPSRYAFYDELLADYGTHPRTIVLSTHLIDEAASLFEDVLIIDHGRLLLHEPADELRSRGVELTGPAAAVDAIAAGHTALAERTLGATKAIVVLDALDDEQRTRARAAGVDLGPIPLQDLFVHLTSREAAR